MKPITTCLPRDSEWSEVGALKENIGRIIIHCARFTAHHTGDRQGTGIVRDKQRTLVEFNLVFVEKP